MGVVEGMTPLLCAVFAEDVDLVRLLAQTLAGTTLLFWGNCCGGCPIVRPEARFGGFVNCCNPCYTCATSQLPFLHIFDYFCIIFRMYSVQLLSKEAITVQTVAPTHFKVVSTSLLTNSNSHI